MLHRQEVLLFEQRRCVLFLLHQLLAGQPGNFLFLLPQQGLSRKPANLAGLCRQPRVEDLSRLFAITVVPVAAGANTPRCQVVALSSLLGKSTLRRKSPTSSTPSHKNNTTSPRSRTSSHKSSSSSLLDSTPQHKSPRSCTPWRPGNTLSLRQASATLSVKVEPYPSKQLRRLSRSSHAYLLNSPAYLLNNPACLANSTSLLTTLQ